MQTCNPIDWEVEKGRSESQGHLQVQSESEGSLGYKRLCLEIKEKARGIAVFKLKHLLNKSEDSRLDPQNPGKCQGLEPKDRDP